MNRRIISYLVTFILFISFFLASSASAQEKYIVSGYIKDASNGEDLAFASVYLKGNPSTGTMSNNYGYYSLELQAGEYVLVFDFVSFQHQEIKITVNASVKLNIELSSVDKILEEVVIVGEKNYSSTKEVRGSVSKIQLEDFKSMPTLGGEVDLIQALQTMPGVKSTNNGNGGFVVRGGGIDQNLVLLDEAVVYNSSHFLNILSTFNSAAVRSATLYKGGSPAEYGGRSSSTLDIRMKEGNKKEWKGSVGVGTIVGKFSVEGPIKKDVGSIIIAGRRTYADLLLIASNAIASDSELYFYDLNMKANYKLGEKDHIYLSGYFGRDILGITNFGISYGNITGTLRWNHLFSDKLFSNTSFIVNSYDFRFGIGVGNRRVGLKSIIGDINLKQNLTYYINNENELKVGFDIDRREIQPGNLVAGSETGFISQNVEKKTGYESAVYVQNQQKIGNLTLLYGLRGVLFNQVGPGTVYEFSEGGEYVGQERQDGIIATYYGLEPRLSATYFLGDNTSVKLGLNRNYQFIHLLTNPAASSPSDVWIMSTNNLKPQHSDQISLGYFKTIKEGMFDFSSEVYYKALSNVIDYENGASAFLNERIEGDLLNGTGTAYGLELQIKKKTGKLTGWVSYTLSRSLRKFDRLNNGNDFPARNDKIHDLAVVLTYKLNEYWSFSTNFLYATGVAVTYPTGGYILDGESVSLYSDRNADRFPDYHRLDIGVSYSRKKIPSLFKLFNKNAKKREVIWNLSVYNVYAQYNPYFIDDFTAAKGSEDTINGQAFSLSPNIPFPSVSYTINF